MGLYTECPSIDAHTNSDYEFQHNTMQLEAEYSKPEREKVERINNILE